MIRRLSRALILLAAAAPAVARVIHVPLEAPTIQAGLDSLQESDTVLVDLGTYAEALSAPPLRFTLKGNTVPDTGEYPRPVIDPTLLPGSDSLACLILPAGARPVIEDLRFRNGPEMFPRAHPEDFGGIRSSALDVVLQRCLFDSVYVGLRQLPDTNEARITISECLFRSDTAWCLLGSPQTVWQVTDCYLSGGSILAYAYTGSRFTGCHFAGTRNGMYLLHASGDDIFIENCVFGPDTLFWAALMATINGQIKDNLFVQCSAGEAALYAVLREGQPPLRILNNTFEHNHPANQSQISNALHLQWEEGMGSGQVVEIRGNSFQHSISVEDAKAVHSDGVGANLQRNRFVDLQPDTLPAVRLQWPDWESPDDSLLLRENLFDEVGVAVQGNEFVDARWNWWGDHTGPFHVTRNPQGQGEEVQGNLLFEPWYEDTSFLSVHEIEPPLPVAFTLDAYPNPFNSTVTLKLIPSQVAIVEVELFDILGRRAQEIWSGPLAYEKKISFDGSHLSSGIYFVRVWQPIGNRPLALQKLVLLK